MQVFGQTVGEDCLCQSNEECGSKVLSKQDCRKAHMRFACWQRVLHSDLRRLEGQAAAKTHKSAIANEFA